MKKITKAALCGVTLSVFAYLSGCADSASTLRNFTYPSDFKYVSRVELRTTMGVLAHNLNRLNNTLAIDDPTQAIEQQQVQQILSDIENAAQQLDARSVGSNHPFLQDQMGRFVDDILQARIAASLNPPNYYYAGRIAGGCVNCHQVNR